MDDYKTTANPRTTTEDGIKVFCAYDDIIHVDDLIPNPGNPKVHDRSQVNLLGDIIIRTGWRAPVTISKRSGRITKGHGRRLAAIAMKLKWVPVEYQEYASEAEEHADVIADNRLSDMAEFDDVKLLDMISDLDDLPIEMTGFTSDDLDNIFGTESNGDDTAAFDRVPADDEPVPSYIQPGDLIVMGWHRMLCGDATNHDDVDKLMNGNKASLIHTDPPYGVSYESQSGRFDMIQNDDKQDDDLLQTLLIPAFKNYVRIANDDAAFYIWHASSTRRDFSDAMIAAGIVEKQYIIWVKNAPVLGHADYQWSHEPCFYAEKAGHHAVFYGDRKQRTTWKILMRDADSLASDITGGMMVMDGMGNKMYVADKPPSGKKLRKVRMSPGESLFLTNADKSGTVWEVSRDTNTIHPTQKPTELAKRAILNSTKEGDIVADFFAGSGSTLMAAEETGRAAYIMELAPHYCDAIINRYMKSTNKNDVTVVRDGRGYYLSELKRGDADAGNR